MSENNTEKNDKNNNKSPKQDVNALATVKAEEALRKVRNSVMTYEIRHGFQHFASADSNLTPEVSLRIIGGNPERVHKLFQQIETMVIKEAAEQLYDKFQVSDENV